MRKVRVGRGGGEVRGGEGGRPTAQSVPASRRKKRHK